MRPCEHRTVAGACATIATAQSLHLRRAPDERWSASADQRTFTLGQQRGRAGAKLGQDLRPAGPLRRIAPQKPHA